MANTSMKALIIFFAFHLGASDDLIQLIKHEGDSFSVKCTPPGRDPGTGSKVTLNNTEEKCFIALELGSTVPIDSSCSFGTEYLELSEDYTMTLTKFHPAHHSGDWQCRKADQPIYRLKGYAFYQDKHKISAKQNGEDLRLSCHFDSFYPPICETKSGNECKNSEYNSLTWMKDGTEINTADVTLTSEEETTGLFNATSVLTLRNTTVKSLNSENSPYQCVFKNFVGNVSEKIYPQSSGPPQSSGSPSGHDIKKCVLLCCLAFIFFK